MIVLASSVALADVLLGDSVILIGIHVLAPLFAAVTLGMRRTVLVAAYQPLIDLRGGQVAGFEALVRWAHPERGLLRSAEFMELAEEPELATRVGAWVLREACTQLARWSEEAPDAAPLALSLAVNLSARQLPQPELPELVADVLAGRASIRRRSRSRSRSAT